MIKKVKNTVPCTYFISDLNVNKFIGTFYEKYLQKTNQKDLKKQSRKKLINYMSNGKAMIILLIVGLTKKALLYKMSYYPEPYIRSKKEI